MDGPKPPKVILTAAVAESHSTGQL